MRDEQKIYPNPDGTWTDGYGRKLVPFTWVDEREPEGSPRRNVPSVRIEEDGHDAGAVRAAWTGRAFRETSEQMARRAAIVSTPHWHTVTGAFRIYHRERAHEHLGGETFEARHARAGWNYEPGTYEARLEAYRRARAAVAVAVPLAGSVDVAAPPVPAAPIGSAQWDAVEGLVREHLRAIHHTCRGRCLVMPSATPKSDPVTGESWIEITIDYAQKETHHVRVGADLAAHRAEMAARLPRWDKAHEATSAPPTRHDEPR